MSLLIRSAINFISVSILLLACSPLRVPLTYFDNKEKEIDREKINKIADDIYAGISDSAESLFLDNIADATPSGGVAPVTSAECKKEFDAWLTIQFGNGFVPVKTISTTEYAKSSTNTNITICGDVDINKLYLEATDDASKDEDNSLESEIISLAQLGEKLTNDGCFKTFTSEENRKIIILGVDAIIKNNMLNIDAPPYDIYVSTEKKGSITAEDLKEKDAIEELIAYGAIIKLGTTKIIPTGFNGTQAVDMVKDPEDLEDARQKLVSLSSDIILFPSNFVAKPTIKSIGGEEFFVVPRGSLSISLSLQFSIGLQFGDAKCQWEKLKKELKDDEQERRNNIQS